MAATPGTIDTVTCSQLSAELRNGMLNCKPLRHDGVDGLFIGPVAPSASPAGGATSGTASTAGNSGSTPATDDSSGASDAAGSSSGSGDNSDLGRGFDETDSSGSGSSGSGSSDDGDSDDKASSGSGSSGSGSSYDGDSDDNGSSGSGSSGSGSSDGGDSDDSSDSSSSGGSSGSSSSSTNSGVTLGAAACPSGVGGTTATTATGSVDTSATSAGTTSSGTTTSTTDTSGIASVTDVAGGAGDALGNTAGTVGAVTNNLPSAAGNAVSSVAGTVTNSAAAVADTAGTANQPSDVIDLSSWNLTLPTGQEGRPETIENPALATFTNEAFKLNDTRDGVVFSARVDGVTTENSSYPRSELRELNGSEKAAWTNTSGSHTLDVCEAITKTPSAKPDVVAAQIHDGSDDVLQIRLEGKTLMVQHDDGKSETVIDPNYVLGTPYNVRIVAEGGKVDILYNGEKKAELPLSGSGWYWKVGAYVQSNTEKGDSPDATGEVVVYSLQGVHA